MGPCDLETALSRIPAVNHPRLLSSIHSREDAGLFLLDNETVLVQTLDFFPPIVDDARAFGMIAAANALSDIYAKGAKPLTAMNIVAFPSDLPSDILVEILLGGNEKLNEAGVLLVGGHTIDDPVPKYGLSVTGIARRAELMQIEGAKPGDRIVLTKPIGTGILTTALKSGFVEESEIEEAIHSMCSLNKDAASILKENAATACTDVTGFGLAGHLYELLRASTVSAEIWCERIPVFNRVRDFADMGSLPAGLFRNRKYLDENFKTAGKLDPFYFDILFDPQTSGGLLATISEDKLQSALNSMSKSGIYAAEIGVIREGAPTTILAK